MADEPTWLADRFEAQRARLRAAAYRMLGSSGEAEDAVQEAWVRLSRTGAERVENLGGWLTTVVARVCLDMLRARKTRREEPLPGEADPPAAPAAGRNPEQELALADSIGLAMLLVLDTLDPAERVAFVLHDMFDVPFDDIATILDRSSVAARQLASRARRRVRGARTTSDADRDRQREVVEAFLAASRSGDFEALLAVLDPDVVVRADRAAVLASAARREAGAPLLEPERHGANAVAETFFGRATAAQLAFIDGMPGAVWAPGGRPRTAFLFATAQGKVVGIHVVHDPEQLRALEIRMPG